MARSFLLYAEWAGGPAGTEGVDVCGGGEDSPPKISNDDAGADCCDGAGPGVPVGPELNRSIIELTFDGGGDVVCGGGDELEGPPPRISASRSAL